MRYNYRFHCGWVSLNKEVPQIKNNILFITLCTEVLVSTYERFCGALRRVRACVRAYVRACVHPLFSFWRPWAFGVAG